MYSKECIANIVLC